MSSIFIKRHNTDAFPKFILLNIYVLHNEKSNYLESFFQQPLISTQMHLFLKEAHFVTALSKSNVCRSGPAMDMIVVIVAVPMFCLSTFLAWSWSSSGCKAGVSLIDLKFYQERPNTWLPVDHDTQSLVDNYLNCEEGKSITYMVNNSSCWLVRVFFGKKDVISASFLVLLFICAWDISMLRFKQWMCHKFLVWRQCNIWSTSSNRLQNNFIRERLGN